MNRLAKTTGLSQPMISLLESSQPNPKLDSLLRIASALQLDVGNLLKQAIANARKKSLAKLPKTGHVTLPTPDSKRG